MEDIEDYDGGDGSSTVLYGTSGTGKTTLAATWPSPILYLDVSDKGTASIKDVKGIKVKRITSFEVFEEMYWALKEDPERFNTVIIDTVSQLQTKVVEEHGARKGTSKKAGEWGSMTKQDWGQVASLLKEWLINYRDLQDLGIHVVFIAQDRAFNFDDEDSEAEGSIAPQVGPALSPSVAKTLNAGVGIIGNTFIRERTVIKTIKVSGAPKKRKEQVIEYCLRVGPNPVYITKVRKPKSISVDEVLVDPSFDDIQALINGEL